MMDNPVSSNGFPGSVAGSVPVVTNSTPLPATETVPRSSPRQRLLAALTGLLPRNLPASNRPSGGATSPSSLYKRASGALTVTAFLAVLAFGLLFLLPGGPAWAQDADTIEYAENGTDPVATYTAVDPEGVAIAWSLGGTDAAGFTIAGGVLAFVKSPNFEKPGDDGMDNIYDVMVEATDGTGHVGRETVKVEVTNVDEDGTVKLSALQPAPDVMFTATLTDIDSPSTDLTSSAEWQWSRSQSATGGWEDIDKATARAYTPDEDGEDSGYYLRATAKYEDRQSPSGADNDKTASMVSANKVLVLRFSNEAPKFAEDQNPDVAGDQENAVRTVTETAAAGQLVGDPVTAEDDDSDDVLTYTLVDDEFDDNFVIDRATGQISVKKGAEFNVTTDGTIDGVDSYSVTVIATDPKGIPTDDVEAIETDDENPANMLYSDTVQVEISVTAEDEPPIFTVTNPSNLDGFDDEGKFTAVSFDETTGVIATGLATFMATDAEAEGVLVDGADDATDVTLGIRGADSSKFDFDRANGVLTFKAAPAAAPNFEKPTDADKDNVYEVTITATDGNANMATRDVKVTVTNAEEDGTVTLSQPRPRVGLVITAGYSDPDGGLASATWQWWKTDAINTSGTPTALPADLAVINGLWEIIEGATSASYMPVDDDDAADSDVGRDLLAVVSYTDAKRNLNDELRDRAGMVSAYPVAEDTRNRAPVFEDQDSDTPGMQNQSAMREVAENTKAGVGNAVTAKDPDPNEDTLVYTLSGADAALFTVASPGQIEVKSGTKLDYEAAKNVYMVTLTATDSFSDSASIDVTIMVTDADEPPDVTGDATKEYAENGTGSVATYMAVDPEGAAVKWSLSGADASLFSIEGGVLAFVKSPDFEGAKDKVGTDTGTPTAVATDNIYDVMVEATDGTGHVGRKAVKVEVTNVDEDGTVSLSALQPAPSVPFTATLTDLDSPTALTDGAKWQWSKSRSKSSGWTDIDKATGSAYTPDQNGGDSGYYLRATAKYKDRQSPSGADNDKTASVVSANRVLVLRNSNQRPEFAEDQNPDVAGDQENAVRTVTETAAAGQLVGDPVTAEDDDSDDVLTYTLVDDEFDDNFVIDRATGQISVKKGAEFNVTTDGTIDGVDSYSVTVIATDPKGIPTEDVEAIETDDENPANMLYSDTVQVEISVTAEDEPPIFTVTNPSNLDGFDDEGKFTAVSFDETTGVIATGLATFMATDAEAEGVLVDGADDATDVTLGIRGADSSKFDFDRANGVLTFKAAPAAAPNFEKPTDADKDNVYEVTITATDGNTNMATRDVKVTVTNAEEDGTVTLSQTRPRVGLVITAGYSDPDGGLASATWQWWRTASSTLGVGDAPVLPDLAVINGLWEIIEGATSASYMPVEGPDADADGKSDLSDVGRHLLAVVSYTDAKRNVDSSDAFDEGARDMAGLVSVNPVARDTRNRAPVFKDQDSDTPGRQNQTATREVAENTKGDVGSAVIAEDPDPNTDPLTYELSGADAALFSVDDGDATMEDVDEGGQITVKSGTKLDFETRTTYMVTITATDSFGESASIDVTITVTDVDEAPKISEGGLAITGPAGVDYAENGMGAVETYMATGPDADMASWSLSGEDMSAFSFSNDGMLTFRSSPDYENPADMGMDNMYMVTITADDGTYMDTHDVMVRVTNEDELGMLLGQDSVGYMENDTVAVGTYTADGPVAASWSLEGDDMGAFTIGGSSGELVFASPPDFEAPTDMGMDNMYQVTVKAEAGGEMDMMDVTVTVTNVDETGEVTLWASASDALTMAPQVGDTITGAVMDPDNPDDDATVESWQWARTMDDMDSRDMDSWMPITGATNAAYMVTEGDTGYYLRVMATYTDAVGTDMDMEYSMPTMMVGAEAGDTLLAKYDADKDGLIQLQEARVAVGDYFGPPKGVKLSLDDTREVVGLYFEYKNRQ